ncbi:unnamed protein product [Dracunculus medinensis]|uniref:JmjC domain-containing protein n=1 Tax=Dracunculus medinensis TaxID=318479 RepID=A0A0N4U539_DRAME|nr:unnamed protein product [Dracunculus medinensis]
MGDRVSGFHNPKELSQIAAYILQCVKPFYAEIIHREEMALASLPLGMGSSTIFSTKFFKTNDSCPLWIKRIPCSIESHTPLDFHLASFIPSFDSLKELLDAVEYQFCRFDIQNGGALCNGNHGRRHFQEEKCYCPRRSPPSIVKIESICMIKDQFREDAYTSFKAHMAAHNPIIVEGVNKHPRFVPALWTQTAFEEVLSRDSNLLVLDSRTFLPYLCDGEPCTLPYFWQRFRSKRFSEEPYLKVKDFPETMLFSDIAPLQYRNLYEVMPFLDYCHINHKESGFGRLNLLNMLIGQEERPDPGPKAYICFGLYDEPYLASTPLHLDVSDAVNFLAVVKPPMEMSNDEILFEVIKRLDIEKIQGTQRERALNNPSKVGALWKVFHPDDNEKLRKAIMEWKNIKEMEWDDDVIHNQDVIVTHEMVQFLESRGIKCKLFIQNEGDVVFIPSGVAHQVQNIFSSIKVAEDFVSLEGIEQTLRVTEELKCLKRKDDLVQIETLLQRACAAATSILSRSEPGMTSAFLQSPSMLDHYKLL